jgi:protoporphyrinogen oxidase
MGEPSRRDVIAAFLGAAAAASCSKKTAPRLDGELLDVALSNTAHALRSAPPPLASASSRTLDAVVVGGGAAGLSAAWRLRRAGVDDFLVAELDDVPGGTAKSGKNAVSAYPWGAHYLPAPLDARGPVPRLLKEMGVLTGVGEDGRPAFAEQALIADPEERLWFRGQWYEGLTPRAGASPDDLAQLERFDRELAALARLRDAKGKKAFDVPLEAGSDDADVTALDKQSMAQWLVERGFTSERVKWLADYACRDDFGARPEDISAYAGVWYFTARQTGDARSEGYLSWPEGNGRLISTLAEAAGAERVRTGLLVHTVAPNDDGTWAVHGFDAKTKTPQWLTARQVVLACPRFVAAKVLAPWRKSPPEFVRAFRYGPWVVANLTLSTAPVAKHGFPLAWDNVAYDSQSLGYVVATHQAERGSAAGPTVLTWYYPVVDKDVVAAREKLFSTKFEDWQDIIFTDLKRLHPGIESTVKRLDMMRWGHAMIRPEPGFLFGGARQQAQASFSPSLHFAHTDLGGLALFEEACHHGVRAAEAALAGLSKRGESWL